MFIRVRRLSVIALLVSLAGCSLPGVGSTHASATATPVGTATPTVPADPCAYTIEPLPPIFSNPPTTGPTTSIFHWTAIAMASADEGWAVGLQYVGTPPNVHYFGSPFLHYYAGRWTSVSSPVHGVLWSLAMVSPTEGWAVGDGGVILHDTGGQWTVAVPAGGLPHMATPKAGYTSVSLTSISMVSPQEGWAVGTGAVIDSFGIGTEVPIFVHYTGGHWVEVDPATLPISGSPNVLLMSSASDGWALGTMTAAHFQDGAWLEDTAFETNSDWSTAQFTGISRASPTEGWAVGQAFNPTSGVIAHLCAGKWERAGAANFVAAGQRFLTVPAGVAMVSPTEGWMVGKEAGANGGPFILHYLQRRWTPVNGSFLFQFCELDAVSMGSADDGWAIGTCPVGNSGRPSYLARTLLVHYHDGVWSLFGG